MIGFVTGLLEWTIGLIRDAARGDKGLEAARAKADKGYRANETDSDDELQKWDDAG